MLDPFSSSAFGAVDGRYCGADSVGLVANDSRTGKGRGIKLILVLLSLSSRLYSVTLFVFVNQQPSDYNVFSKYLVVNFKIPLTTRTEA